MTQKFWRLHAAFTMKHERNNQIIATLEGRRLLQIGADRDSMIIMKERKRELEAWSERERIVTMLN